MKNNPIALFEYDWTPTAKIYFEHTISVNDNSYLVIFGRHINGGFIAIPNWNISCEATDILPSAGFNREKLVQAGLDENAAIAIANYVEEEYRAIVEHRTEENYETRYAVVERQGNNEEVIYIAKTSEAAEKYAAVHQKAHQKMGNQDIEFSVRPVPVKSEDESSEEEDKQASRFHL